MFKRNKSIEIPKGRPQETRRSTNRFTNMVLVALWSGTFLLLIFMMYRWEEKIVLFETKEEKDSSFLVDDILLSSADLKLDSTSSLINISLNSEPVSSSSIPEKKSSKPAQTISRDELYKNILNQKIKKAENKSSGGFAIKPLPE